MPQAIQNRKHPQPLAVTASLRTKAALLLTLARELTALAAMAAALGTGFLLLASTFGP